MGDNQVSTNERQADPHLSEVPSPAALLRQARQATHAWRVQQLPLPCDLAFSVSCIISLSYQAARQPWGLMTYEPKTTSFYFIST